MPAPYLHGVLVPDVLVVQSRHVEALKERLGWAGPQLSETLSLKRA